MTRTFALQQIKEQKAIQDARHERGESAFSLAMRENSFYVRFLGTDAGDYYCLLQESFKDEFRYHYLFFYQDGELYEHFDFPTMIEAISHLAYRFVLDNCDDADTRDAGALATHEHYKRSLVALANKFRSSE